MGVGKGKGKGGKRNGAGRKTGSVAKATGEQIKDIAAYARTYTKDAVDTLVEICRGGESESARVAASNVILNRGYGQAPATLKVDGDLNVKHDHVGARERVSHLIAGLVDAVAAAEGSRSIN